MRQLRPRLHWPVRAVRVDIAPRLEPRAVDQEPTATGPAPGKPPEAHPAAEAEAIRAAKSARPLPAWSWRLAACVTDRHLVDAIAADRHRIELVNDRLRAELAEARAELELLRAKADA